MANSILQGVVSQPVDLAGAFARGQQMYNQNQNAQLDQQRAKQDIGEVDYQKNVRKLKIANRLAKQAIGLPQEARAKLMQDYSGALMSVGFTQDDLANTPLDDAGLQNLIAQTDSVIQASAPQQAQQGSQFGAQETLKDEEGNIFFSTSRRNPNTGEMAGVVAAADGSNTKPVGRLSVAGSYGQTAQERIGQVGAEAGARTQATQNVMAATEPQIRAEIERQTQAAKLAQESRAEAIKAGNKYGSLLSGFEEAKAIIPMSTGSTLGALRDVGGRVIGYSTDAAQNTRKLRALSAWLITQVPKPGGAVSDADLAQFKKAVGEIDDNVPAEERMAAVDMAMTIINKWNTEMEPTRQDSAPQQNRRVSDKKPVQDDGAVDWSTLP